MFAVAAVGKGGAVAVLVVNRGYSASPNARVNLLLTELPWAGWKHGRAKTPKSVTVGDVWAQSTRKKPLIEGVLKTDVMNGDCAIFLLTPIGE